jgi:23S rRNA (cytosine1962-C5)-methyltransferase
MANVGAGDSFGELRLARGEERRLEAGHLWVFSNEVDTARTPLSGFAAGDICRVTSARDRFLGYAYVNPHALICARILARDPRRPPSRALLTARIGTALRLRERLYDAPFYRAVYGESDGLPGLVLDRYGDVVVGQIATAGMEAMKDAVTAAVVDVLDPRVFVWKNDGGAREMEGLPSAVEVVRGELPDTLEVRENGVVFRAPLAAGQKTGWFYDQARNRRALGAYVRGARVLDVFSYVGSFGVTAARQGAAAVTCVDSSAPALAMAEENAKANGVDVHTLRGDAFDALEELLRSGQRYDVVVLDPPAFVKKKRQLPKGEAAYRRLNQLGMQLLVQDGVLVSCSCSYHLPPESLLGAIQKAGRNTGRFVQVLESGGQSPDHPVHPAIPETRYLKAFFCRAVQEQA